MSERQSLCADAPPVGNWTADTNRTSDGRIVCVRCGCLAVMTSNGRWICGGKCPN